MWWVGCCAGIPAVLLLLGGCILPETPSSLIERGRLEKGRMVLQKIRGVQNVDAEYDDIKVKPPLLAMYSGIYNLATMYPLSFTLSLPLPLSSLPAPLSLEYNLASMYPSPLPSLPLHLSSLPPSLLLDCILATFNSAS